MPTKWWNKSFLPSSPQRTPILTTTHGWECLCGSLEVQLRSSSTSLEGKKNLRLDALKKVKGTVLLYPQGGTVQRRERSSWSMISPMGKSESMWVSTQISLIVQDAAKEAHFSLEYCHELYNRGSERGWKNGTQGSEYNITKGHRSY